MRQITASGQTVEEAVQSSLKQLNTSRDQVEVEIVDEGKRGVFGLFGSKPAIVKVSIVQNQVEQAEEYLKSVAEQMGANIEVSTTVKDKEVTFDMVGEKIAILIGKRGQTLNALQYLLHLVINRDGENYYTVILDAEGYRNRRKDTLHTLAERLADKAVRTQKEVPLEPMPAFERKIIHTALQNNQYVSTYSYGAEPHRHVVIKS